MKVEQPNLRETVFDCPWTGHQADPNFLLKNSSAPELYGLRCVKCGALVYVVRPKGEIVGADGAPLPAASEAVIDVAAMPPNEVN